MTRLARSAHFVRKALRALVVAGMLVGSGCGGSGASDDTTLQPIVEPPAGDGSITADGEWSWPSVMVTGPGSGPALFLGPEAGSPAIGYVSSGIQIELAGQPTGDRAPVRIRGSMKVRAWLATDRFALRVQRRGKVRGTPAYVGPNDLVRVLGAAEPGRARVEVRPILRRSPDVRLEPFVGTFPTVGLGPDEVDAGPDAQPTPGTPMRLPQGVEVPLYDQPGGTVISRLPALEPPLAVTVLIDRGEWKGVRAGVGPYIVGFVSTPLTPTDQPESANAPVAAARVPLRLQSEPNRPLWRLPAGTRVRFDGQTIAILDQDGFAREMARHDQSREVDVFVAVDEGVAIRGLIPIDAPQPVPR